MAKIEKDNYLLKKDLTNLNNNNNFSDDSDDEEQSEHSIGETKNNILKALDERINQNKEELKQTATIQQKKEEILKIAKGLKGDIKNLDLASKKTTK